MGEENKKNELETQTEGLTRNKENFYQALKQERLSVQRSGNEVVLKNSIKAIGVDLAQRTTPSALDKIVEFVNSAKRKLKEKRKFTNNREEVLDSNASKLTLEEIIVGEAPSKSKIENDKER